MLRTSSHGCSSMRPIALAKRVGHRAGEAQGTFLGLAHVSRHTCASMLFRRGLNAKQLQVWLGHHSLGFTLSVYSICCPGDMPSAGQQITPKAAEVSERDEGGEAAHEQGFLSPTETARRLRGQLSIPRSKVRILHGPWELLANRYLIRGSPGFGARRENQRRTEPNLAGALEATDLVGRSRRCPRLGRDRSSGGRVPSAYPTCSVPGCPVHFQLESQGRTKVSTPSRQITGAACVREATTRGGETWS